MTRKLFLTLIIVLLTSLFLASPALAAKTYRADRFDVQIDLQENGSAIITETIEFYFEGGDFTYAFRNISATETDGVTFIEASMDGVAMSPGTQAGQVEVEAGDRRGSAQGDVAFLPHVWRVARIRCPLSRRWPHP
jgi:hypothetical protein